jgi:uncharacterized protein YdaU (DUF1376 family)
MGAGAMSETPFMPLWVADFVGDTLDLDAKEIGAYMLILMTMWGRDGVMPNDQKKLQRVARCGRDWPRVWASIGHYFTVDGENITQTRLRLELQKVASKRIVNAQSGAHGGRAKALKNKDVGLANATVSLKQPEPYPESDKKTLPSIPRSAGGKIQFDPRDVFVSGDYVFDEKRWFTENETALLEEKHSKIDVRAKLADKKFRDWAFRADFQNPLLPARKWFAKQDRVEEATVSLADSYVASKNMKLGDLSHLQKTLERKAGKR